MAMPNGRPVVMEAVCSALRPPPNSSAAATAPSVNAQNIRIETGDSALPAVVSLSTTMDPESEEVTKKLTTSNNPSADVKDAYGKCSRNLNNAEDTSC